MKFSRSANCRKRNADRENRVFKLCKWGVTSQSEPICFNKIGIISLTTTIYYEKNIPEAIDWINYDLSIWAKGLNFFSPVYIRISKL
jgi:hypothetical protein